MTLTDILIAAVIALIITAVIIYIVRKKRQGVKCIGCPSESSCKPKEGKSGGCDCSH